MRLVNRKFKSSVETSLTKLDKITGINNLEEYNKLIGMNNNYMKKIFQTYFKLNCQFYFRGL